MLYSGKQGLTVPVEPSPAESRLGTTTEGLSKHRVLVLLPLCKWLLPPGAQQVPGSQPGLCGEQGGREERKSVSLGSEDGFSLAATARRYCPWTSVYPSARGNRWCALMFQPYSVRVLSLDAHQNFCEISWSIYSVWTNRCAPRTVSGGGRTGGNSSRLCHRSHCQLTPAPLPILQTGKLRPRKEKWPAQDYRFS